MAADGSLMLAGVGLDRPAVVVGFAGGGGSSIAIEAALGLHPDAALNHWNVALGVHARNYPDTAHFCGDIRETDPHEVCPGRRIGLLWLSPDCRHFSKAKGSAPVSPRVRGLAWVAINWAIARKPDFIMVENVEEFQTWGPVDADGQPIAEHRGRTFRLWVKRLRQCGYSVDWRIISAADHGSPTIRKRLFIVARRDGLAAVWPAPTHAPRAKATGGLKPYRAAAECIDFSRPCPSIFMPPDEAKALRIKRPLQEATLARIAKGLLRYTIAHADPFIVPVTHRGDLRSYDVREPLRTVTTAKRGEFALVAPRVAFMEQANTGMVGHDARSPLSTIVGRGTTQRLIAAQLSHFRTSNVGGGEADPGEPLTAITAQGRHHALLQAALESEHDLARPFHPRERELRAFLVKYYGTAGAQDIADPLHSVTSRARFGLVVVAGVAYRIVDIGMRMLDPETELAAAMGVPKTYVLGFTAGGERVSKTNITKMVGNMVAKEPVAALVAANCGDLFQPWRVAA